MSSSSHLFHLFHKLIKEVFCNFGSFFNEETEGELIQYLRSEKFQASDQLFFKAKQSRKIRMFNNSRKKYPQITPKVLRQWLSCEMARIGIQDRYVDAFCGRVPKSILARHYTDFSPERLNELYNKTSLNVLN